ncbi:Wall-associated receptor kinase [Trema orientale]|uniref:Wall-associated receptor kinase n=1 Tax=Trema orientale TaxID=63057 RepID=A0A2P5FVY9_TREOI|nr:Wall-associated receptor kinase [Trema orientale]
MAPNQRHVPRKVLVLPLQLLLWLMLLLVTKSTSQPTTTTTTTGSGACLHRCGSVNIPYPFGTGPGCYYDKSFLVTCNDTSSSSSSVSGSTNSPKLFFPRSKVSILSISLDGELRVEGPVGRNCYNRLGNRTSSPSEITPTMITRSKFPISGTRNKFVTVGCDTFGVIVGDRGQNYSAGCISICSQIKDVVNGSCSGVGCCQMSVPNNVMDFAVSLGSIRSDHTEVFDFNPCGYTFVVEADSYEFSSADLRDFQKRETVPVVLDWAVGNLTCEEAQENVTGYACRASNSACLNSTNGPGYRCKCLDGFEGNPYLVDGCQDINECEGSTNPCVTRCNNLPGNFSCSKCPKGFKGDGTKEGTGCTPTDSGGNRTVIVSIALGISIGLLLLLLAGSWMYWALRKRKLIKLKEKFFQQNGGILLQQQLVHQRGSSEAAKIFTAEQLKKATNNYDQSRVLGQGGYGTVYKGVLPDSKVVAIKKSKIGNQSQIEQFINEVIVLSQINHRNVVKLLGCCLETEVPLLVYEFITNGTLSDHIHKRDQYSSLSWEMRLKIATETAGAIAYLHSSTSMPIIHRDIKTANILLDENYTTKVSDFGASRLVPLDQTQLTTLVQGTLGYLDPEYFQTSQLTEKSDVYSFGVVLAELMTGQRAIAFDREESDINLANYFISSVKEGQLLQILEAGLANEGNIEQLNVVANVVKSCLRVNGHDRPTMKEVASELEGLMRSKGGMHPWGQDHNPLLTSEETEYLLKSSLTYLDEDKNGGPSSIITTTGLDSLTIEMLKPYDDGDGR